MVKGFGSTSVKATIEYVFLEFWEELSFQDTHFLPKMLQYPTRKVLLTDGKWYDFVHGNPFSKEMWVSGFANNIPYVQVQKILVSKMPGLDPVLHYPEADKPSLCGL